MTIALLLSGFIGMWELSIITLVQVVAAVVIVGGDRRPDRDLGGTPTQDSEGRSARSSTFSRRFPPSSTSFRW